MKNTGSVAWQLDENYSLLSNHQEIRLDLTKTVKPNELAVFYFNDFNIVSEDVRSHKILFFRMFKKDFGWFGESTPDFDITVSK